nr:MAG TPA: hypothetical protein [Caudoviricetes sp.]
MTKNKSENCNISQKYLVEKVEVKKLLIKVNEYKWISPKKITGLEAATSLGADYWTVYVYTDDAEYIYLRCPSGKEAVENLNKLAEFINQD